MRALTVWQAWASLLVLGAKGNETRGWSTKYRGPLAIHAAHRAPKLHEITRPVIADALREAGIIRPSDLPLGAVLGIVELVDVISTKELLEQMGRGQPVLTMREFQLGNYEAGRFAWVVKPVEVFKKPIPARGYQGFWTWDREERV